MPAVLPVGAKAVFHNMNTEVGSSGQDLVLKRLNPLPETLSKKEKKMNVKRGIAVSHMAMNEWGTGMVVAVADGRATIQFSDGIIRKIASSHYTTLQPADPASFLPPPESVPVEKKVRAVRKSVKKTKEPVV
jgi:hypothetical protein